MSYTDIYEGIEALQAYYLAGLPVEVSDKGLDSWALTADPIWDWKHYDYRPSTKGNVGQCDQ